MVQYGWVSEKESLSNILGYNRSRIEGYHIFAAQAQGEVFGYREYNSLITLDAYMNSPVNLIEDLLDGVAVGQRKIKAELARRAKAHRDKLDPNKVINQHLKKEGLQNG